MNIKRIALIGSCKLANPNQRESAEGYLAEIQHYAEMCTKYQHLHASVDIANRYLSVATFLVKQMKGEI